MQGNGPVSFLWSLLHKPGDHRFGPVTFSVRYPVLPWIGIMAVGYCIGQFYRTDYDAVKRRKILLFTGVMSIMFFILLRAGNYYGDAAHWSMQKNTTFILLSFINVTKYPPSLLYILMTLGIALIFLSLAEKPLNPSIAKITILGRVPMFYYLLHIFLIHFLAIIGAVLSGYHWQDMIFSTRINQSPQLKGYGFSLPIVYTVWTCVILLLCPLCIWYDHYKRKHQSSKWWLGYL